MLKTLRISFSLKKKKKPKTSKQKQIPLQLLFHVTKLSGPIPASCFQTWVWMFSSLPSNQFCKNQAGSLTALISFQTLSLNTRVDLKGLWFSPTFNRTQTVQNTNQAAMNFASNRAAKSSLFILLWLCWRRPHRKPERCLHTPCPHNSFFPWESRKKKADWSPKTPALVCLLYRGSPLGRRFRAMEGTRVPANSWRYSELRVRLFPCFSPRRLNLD